MPPLRAENLKGYIKKAVDGRMSDVEKQPTHACKVLAELLLAAPADAHIFDVLALTFKTCDRSGLPPGVAGVPGRALILHAYEECKADRPPTTEVPEAGSEEERKELKKKAMEEWRDVSALLKEGIELLLRRVDSAGASEAQAQPGLAA
ncbi:hypothetical protein DIPPA_12897 [Diplonema papillatum]|nr:hypothetical protein DIPPA_12897 [Diplonema papillatum]